MINMERCKIFGDWINADNIALIIAFTFLFCPLAIATGCLLWHGEFDEVIMEIPYITIVRESPLPYIIYSLVFGAMFLVYGFGIALQEKWDIDCGDYIIHFWLGASILTLVVGTAKYFIISP